MVLNENGLAYHGILSAAHGSPIIRVFPVLNMFTKFRRGHPLWGHWI